MKPAYRKVHDIIEARFDQINSASYQVLSDLDMEVTPANLAQARTLLGALALYDERSGIAHDAWKEVGVLGNLLTLWGKVKRLMNQLWYKKGGEDARAEDVLDNLYDSMNYIAFMVRSLEAGDMTGEKSGDVT